MTSSDEKHVELRAGQVSSAESILDERDIVHPRSHHFESIQLSSGLQEDSLPGTRPTLSRESPEKRNLTFAWTDCVVPRSERRGLLGRLTIIPEIERPYEYNRRTKWMVTAVVALAAAAAPMGSGIFYRRAPNV